IGPAVKKAMVPVKQVDGAFQRLWSSAQTGARSTVESLRDQIRFMQAGGSELVIAMGRVESALKAGILSPDEADAMFGRIEAGLIGVEEQAGLIDMDEAVEAMEDFADVGTWKARRMVEEIQSQIDAIPKEILFTLQAEWGAIPTIPGLPAGKVLNLFTGEAEAPAYTPKKKTKGQGGVSEFAGGGELAAISKVGEKGWEYIIGGVVVPHRMSMELERLGLRSQRNFALAGGSTPDEPYASGYQGPADPGTTDIPRGPSGRAKAPPSTTTETAQMTQIATVAAQQQATSQATFTTAITSEQAKTTKAQKDGTKELKGELQEIRELLQVMNDMLPEEIQAAVSQVVG
ncbi:MAG: hypothetical protein ACXABY_15605, partial [Candidatus Thorarchaeota archaeon]